MVPPTVATATVHGSWPHISPWGAGLVQRLDGDPSTHISHAIGWSDVDLLEPAQIEHQALAQAMPHHP